MPKYAVMTFMFRPWWADGRMTHEGMLQGFAGAGAEGIEPFHRDFIDDPDLLPRYRRALNDNGLRTAAVDIICNLVHANTLQRREGRDELRRGLDICHALGGEIAHVAGHRLVPGVSATDGRKMIADGLLEFAEVARSGGMTLAIENFDPSPDLICSVGDCLEVLDSTGNDVQFVLDTGNFIAVGEDSAVNFEQVADRICHCHFKDFVRIPDQPNGYRGCDMGQGVIPNAAVARKLRAQGFDRWVALETRGRDDIDPISAVQQELPVLRSWFT